MSLTSHNYLGMEPSFYLFPIWNMVLNLLISKWFLYDNRWCRQTYFIMGRLVWLRNLAGLLILLPRTLLRSLVVSYLMTQIWGCHFGHMQRLLEMVLWAYGTNLTLLRHIFWHLGTTYILKYYIKFSAYNFLTYTSLLELFGEIADKWGGNHILDRRWWSLWWWCCAEEAFPPKS